MLLPSRERELVELFVTLRKYAFAQTQPKVAEYFARGRAKMASTEDAEIPYALALHLRTL